MMEVAGKADTADAVETAIERSKSDERLTWAELVTETHLRIKSKDESSRAIPSRSEQPETSSERALGAARRKR